MLISEIFYSVQGEGVLTGVPSIFIRTSGCNLRCRWCDTPYASWNPEGEELNVAEILDRIATWPAARHVVLTGGEPMVARGIHELAGALKERGLHITIETAGDHPAWRHRLRSREPQPQAHSFHASAGRDRTRVDRAP